MTRAVRPVNGFLLMNDFCFGVFGVLNGMGGDAKCFATRVRDGEAVGLGGGRLGDDVVDGAAKIDVQALAAGDDEFARVEAELV